MKEWKNGLIKVSTLFFEHLNMTLYEIEQNFK